MSLRFVAAALVYCLAIADGVADIPTGGQLGDGKPTLMYDPSNGELTLEADGVRITTFELVANEDTFIGKPPTAVLPPFDQFTARKVFLLKPDGISKICFGPILEPKLELRDLASNLTAHGSLRPNGDLELDLALVDPKKRRQPAKRALVSVYWVRMDRKAYVELLEIDKRSKFESWHHRTESASVIDQLQFVTTDGGDSTVMFSHSNRCDDYTVESTDSTIQCKVDLKPDSAQLSLTQQNRSPKTRTDEIEVKYDDVTIIFGTVTESISATVITIEPFPPKLD